MHYVYIIRSLKHPEQTYIGCTADLKQRLIKHNEGTTVHTAKYKPWKVEVYVGFENKECAIAFESYLKTASGKNFICKRLWLS